MTDTPQRIKEIRYVDPKAVDIIPPQDTLTGFFNTFFSYTVDKDAADYCNDESYVVIEDEAGGIAGYISPCDFIAAAYHSLVLWHDGGKGYELLSVLGMHYKPSPMGSLDTEVEIVASVLDEHFNAGGGY